MGIIQKQGHNILRSQDISLDMATCHDKLLHSILLASSLKNLLFNCLFTNKAVDSNLHQKISAWKYLTQNPIFFKNDPLMTNKPRPKIESHDNGDWKAFRTGEDYIFLCNPWAIIWRWTKKIEKKKKVTLSLLPITQIKDQTKHAHKPTHTEDALYAKILLISKNIIGCLSTFINQFACHYQSWKK